MTIQCNAVSSMGFEEEIYQWVLTIRFNYQIAINSSIRSVGHYAVAELFENFICSTNKMVNCM